MAMNNETNAWNAGDYANNSSDQAAWAKELIAKLGLGGSEHPCKKPAHYPPAFLPPDGCNQNLTFGYI